MKDNFSSQSAGYAQYRPVYPQELFEFILQHVPERKLAWDCGTGNGQTASELAIHFEQVIATDLSEEQLSHAIQKHNILYRKETAEATILFDDIVNLTCVSQALHWFDFDAFYKEVKRVSTQEAIIAAWCYSHFQADKFTNLIMHDFYFETLKHSWDNERHWVDEGYKTIPFPFKEIPVQPFFIKTEWTTEQLEGYLDTWSAVRHYIKTNGFNPVPHVMDEIKKRWPLGEKRTLVFPVHMRLGYVH